MQDRESNADLVGQRLEPDAGRASESWEPPIPFGRFDLPEFPLEAIPGQLCAFREFCAAVAESYQVPADLPALLGLAVAGTALAKRIEVYGGGDWYDPINLFVAVAMESGERKSAVFRAVSAPIAEYERRETERLAPAIERNQTERTILAMSLKDAQTKAAKATKPEDREAARQRAQDLVVQLQGTETLYAPRYIADDATPEALSRLLAEHEGRMALLSPEGDTFDLMAGRYNDRGPNLGVYLKGHAGDDIRVDRVSRDRPPEHVHRPALTVGLAVQPDVLRGLMDKKGFRGRGLLARFIYAIPISLVGHRKLRPLPVSAPTAHAYTEMIRTALAIKPAIGEDGKPRPHVVVVGKEAMTELDGFRMRVENELRPGGGLEAMKDWAGKLPGAVCRIAGIFHGLTHAKTGDLAQRQLDAETMLCAMAIGEYAIAHARAAYYEMGASPVIALARCILSWVMEEKLSEFTRRDAFNRLRGTVHRVDKMDEPLRLMADHGYIRERPQDRTGPGRKPSTIYEINPLVYAQNTHNTQNLSGRVNSAHSAECARRERP
ncbi:MAG: YfjI family protein [Phycisphaerae bacterium]